jgi:dolichol-phosphate mannosyltransferase
MRLLVIVPTYCEKETIEQLLERIRTALPQADILVVDDRSPDGTADLAEKAGIALGAVHVLRRDGRRGLGSAYRSGYAWGLDLGYEAFFAMDADLSHDPAALPDFLAGLDGHDVVVGSRYIPGGGVLDWSWHRRALSRAGNWYSSWMLGLPIHDLTSGFRAYRAEILRAIDLDTVRAEGYGFQIEMTYRAAAAGARFIEIPICFSDRELGKSKMSGHIVTEALALVTRWGLTRRWVKWRGGTDRFVTRIDSAPARSNDR